MTMSPDIRVFSPEELPGVAAAELATAIEAAVARRGRCRFAVAGGSTPVPVYERLAAAPSLPWSAVELWFGDERAVEPGDPASNYAMVRRALIDRVALPADNVHRIHGELPAADAARAYAEALGDEPLDVALLGMGGDGHTASLFPDTPNLGGADRVRATHSPVPPHDRISLGLPVLNRAGAVYVLVAGANKAARLAQVRDEIAGGAPVLPAARIQPESGRLIWLVDTDAASMLRTPR